MEEKRNETASMIIRFYNMQAGTAFRTGNEANIKFVSGYLTDELDNVRELKDHIRNYIATSDENIYTTGDGFKDCFKTYLKPAKVTPIQEEAPTPTPQVNTVTDSQVQYSMGILEQAVVGLIANMNSAKIESEIMGTVEQKIQDFIKDEYGTIERKIITVIDDKPVPMQGIQHDKFETVLKFVANDEPVFLSGPAGSGKNVLCKQVAEALGLKFYFTNAVTQEYKLTGFTDAMGKYQETQFYKAFTQGGVFMLDEIDASIPEVLVILNAAIANRYFDFPAPIGYVEAHPDFRVIAAGNTLGQGASLEYIGRNQLDGASLDRFAIIEVGYSEAIENTVACGNLELSQFAREFRKSAQKNGVQVIVSYRAIGRMAKMEKLLDTKEMLHTCLIKGMEKDDLTIITEGIKTDSKYKRALADIIASMNN